jgi:hypothetical protein
MIYNINFGTGKLEAIDASDKNNLEVGRILHMHGYNEPDYVITANRGIDPQWKSFGAIYDCINLSTGGSVREQAYTLSWEKEQRKGIHVAITEKIMEKEEMTWALIAAAATKAENDRIKKEKVENEAKDRASLPARFPYLKQGSGVVVGASNIRVELKRAFPSIKFTVHSEHRGSSSINIGWTDGPTREQVTKITGKYQEGNFNGMEDIYEYNHENQWPDIFGGARYVFANRHESPALILKVGNEMGFKIESGESNNYGILFGLTDDQSQMIYRQARQTAV